MSKASAIAPPIRALLTLALAGVLCARFSVGTARAEDAPTIAVIGVHGDGTLSSEEMERISDDVVAGFIESRFEAIYGDELALRLERSRETLPEKVFLAPVRDAVNEGQRLYRKAQPDKAVEVLQAAAVMLEQRKSLLRSPQLAVDLYLNLGLSQLSKGDRSQAERSFAEVVRIDPNRVLDSVNYSPKLMAAFDAVRDRMLAAPSGSIFVSLPGIGVEARVYVDGRLVGTTPITASRLPAGRHLVVVDGGELGQSVIDVDLAAGEQKDLEVLLSPGSLAVEDELFTPAKSKLSATLYREIGQASGVDLIAVAAFGPEGDFHLALYSPRAGAFSEPISATLQAAPGARTAFVRQLVQRISRYADDRGNIRSERLARQGLSMRVGDNPMLDALLWPRPQDEILPEEPRDDDAVARKKPPPPNPKVLGILGGIIGGSLAALGIGFGVDRALREQNSDHPVGVLIITIP